MFLDIINHAYEEGEAKVLQTEPDATYRKQETPPTCL
jgi:hypothetical protein